MRYAAILAAWAVLPFAVVGCAALVVRVLEGTGMLTLDTTEEVTMPTELEHTDAHCTGYWSHTSRNFCTFTIWCRACQAEYRDAPKALVDAAIRENELAGEMLAAAYKGERVTLGASPLALEARMDQAKRRRERR